MTSMKPRFKKTLIEIVKKRILIFFSFFIMLKQNIIDSSPEVSLQSNFDFVILQTLSLPCFPPETFSPLKPEVLIVIFVHNFDVSIILILFCDSPFQLLKYYSKIRQLSRTS